ncbi:MAG TPA: hydrogenase maturation protease [Smithellaceae bacterium]|nr:hydrogenase maturation protease [Smithellaceae bacterium]
MFRTIVVGYGNIDRADDGVAYVLINILRQNLGQKVLSEGDTGLEELGLPVDSIFLSQLMPEIMETLAAYDRIIFVDAHVDAGAGDLNCLKVTPEYGIASFTHHMTPAGILAFLQLLYNRDPASYIVSVRGFDFDFKRELSSATSGLIRPAVEKILQLLQADCINV